MDVGPGSYDDLKNLISTLPSGGTLDLDRDYTFDHYTKDNYYGAIVITNDDITINGNGHIIDAGRVGSAIFKVVGDHVNIYNVTFFNSCPTPDRQKHKMYSNRPEYYIDNVASPVVWEGRYGKLSNCAFVNNEATNGGALTSYGARLLIENCLFLNNTARGVGGAIYIGASHNTIVHSDFINSTSLATGEAVFINDMAETTTFENIMFTGDNFAVKAQDRTVNPLYLYYTYDFDFAGKSINLVSALYALMMNGGICYMGHDFSYYGQYDNETKMFLFTVARHMENGINYAMLFKIRDIEKPVFSEIMLTLCEGRYWSDVTLTKDIYVNDLSGYQNAYKTFAQGPSTAFRPLLTYLDNLPDVLKNNIYSKTLALNVIFTGAYKINSDLTWNPSIFGWNLLNFDGHGSTIEIENKKRGENHWVYLTKNCYLSAGNLTIRGFNSAIYNDGGYCILNDVELNKNGMDYILDRDWGGAILNLGTLICNNCRFTDNYAENGAAIFNQGLVVVQNCTFSGNDADNNGNNICVGEGGAVVVNGEQITKDTSIVRIVESLSKSKSIWITIGSICGSFVAGFVVGVFAGPLVGAAVGAAVGAVVGSLSANYIISHTYDVHFDRLQTAILLIGGSVAAGILGGAIGGWVGAANSVTSASSEVAPATTSNTAGSGSISTKSGGIVVKTVTKEGITQHADGFSGWGSKAVKGGFYVGKFIA